MMPFLLSVSEDRNLIELCVWLMIALFVAFVIAVPFLDRIDKKREIKKREKEFNETWDAVMDFIMALGSVTVNETKSETEKPEQKLIGGSSSEAPRNPSGPLPYSGAEWNCSASAPDSSPKVGEEPSPEKDGSCNGVASS